MTITFVVIAVVGLLVLGLTAVAIGIVESAQASAWRKIAAERRVAWERRQEALGRRRYVDAWADEDTD